MASYLSNRKQFISNSEIKTDMEIVQYGVSQDSNLGPLMFLVYQRLTSLIILKLNYLLMILAYYYIAKTHLRWKSKSMKHE